MRTSKPLKLNICCTLELITADPFRQPEHRVQNANEPRQISVAIFLNIELSSTNDVHLVKEFRAAEYRQFTRNFVGIFTYSFLSLSL